MDRCNMKLFIFHLLQNQIDSSNDVSLGIDQLTLKWIPASGLACS